MSRTVRVASIVALVLFAIGTTGCLISTQDGERQHVNSPPPDEITFHFHTPFNKLLVFGRSALLAMVALWAIKNARGAGAGVYAAIAAGSLLAASWLLVVGWKKMVDYRIEVGRAHLQLEIPSEPAQSIEWSRIHEIYGEGQALDVRFSEGGKGQALQWAPQWEELTIQLDDGTKRDVDLRPLSVEQRGTLWRAIGEKAQLTTSVSIQPR